LFTYYSSSLSSATVVASGSRIRPPSGCVRGMIPGRNQHMPRHGGSRHSSQQRTASRRPWAWAAPTDLTAKPATSETGDLGLCFECFRGLALALRFPRHDSVPWRRRCPFLSSRSFYDAQMRGIYNSIIQVDPNMLSFLMR
jgi:hypothetical protein